MGSRSGSCGKLATGRFRSQAPVLRLFAGEFEQVDPPILDWDRDTARQGNVMRMLDQEGERTVPVPTPGERRNDK